MNREPSDAYDAFFANLQPNVSVVSEVTRCVDNGDGTWNITFSYKAITQEQLSTDCTDDLGSKLAARLLLAGRARHVVVPSSDEMRGVYLLERDDELPGRRR